MKKILSLSAALAALFVLLFCSQQAADSCRASLRLCSELIIPTLLPFFLLSGLLGALRLPEAAGRIFGKAAEKLFGVSGRGFTAFFHGILGGYPLGASAIADMWEREEISSAEASRLLGFCSNTGPAFIVGAIGGRIFGSPGAGLFLYAVHIASALLTGLILNNSNGDYISSPLPQPSALSFSAALARSVRQAVVNMLNVCGFICCFGVFSGLLDELGIMPRLISALSLLRLDSSLTEPLIKGIIELGNGVGAMAGLPLCPASLGLAAFIVGFGGLAVHFQTLALIADTDISPVPHLKGRILSAIIAAAIAYTAGFLVI